MLTQHRSDAKCVSKLPKQFTCLPFRKALEGHIGSESNTHSRSRLADEEYRVGGILKGVCNVDEENTES